MFAGASCKALVDRYDFGIGEARIDIVIYMIVFTVLQQRFPAPNIRPDRQKEPGTYDLIDNNRIEPTRTEAVAMTI